MIKQIFLFNVILNSFFIIKLYDNINIIFNILYLILYEFIFSMLITLICVLFTIIIVNLLHYLKFNNYIIYIYLLNLIKIFTIQTPELKIMSIIMIKKVCNLDLINMYSVALIYNLHLILLFFKEISNLENYSYITICMYTNRITVFFRHTLMLYFKYLKNKTILIFFYILGDNWILYNNDQYSIMYLLIYNIITTTIYLKLY